MTTYRVDHVPNGGLRNGATTWWPDEDSALAEESRLRWSGCQRVVAWRWDGAEACDVAAEGLARAGTATGTSVALDGAQGVGNEGAA